MSVAVPFRDEHVGENCDSSRSAAAAVIRSEEAAVQIVHPQCCGLDVHKKSVVACVLISQPDGLIERQVRTFKTVTGDLLALADWLSGLGVTHVALESTGVYWRPVFNVLEDDSRTLLLVNPQHMRAVPGKKTDVRDSEWLADLLRHGLLQGSFIPPAPIRAVRELTRYRKTLVQERTDEINRLQKTLEGANIKLASVASDVLGMSSRAMLTALLDGERDPDVMADLAQGRLRNKLPELRQALAGRIQPHHMILVGQILAHIDFLEQAIGQMQTEIERCLPPFEVALELLQSIPRHQGCRRRGDPGRDRHRHEPVPQRGPPGLVGRSLSQQQAECRQTDESSRQPGQCVVTSDHGCSRLERCQDARHLLPRAVPAYCPAARAP